MDVPLGASVAPDLSLPQQVMMPLASRPHECDRSGVNGGVQPVGQGAREAPARDLSVRERTAGMVVDGEDREILQPPGPSTSTGGQPVPTSPIESSGTGIDRCLLAMQVTSGRTGTAGWGTFSAPASLT